MPKKDKDDEKKKMLAFGCIAIIGCIILASFLYALTWPIRVGSMALWSIMFSNAVYPDPKDASKNFTLKIILLAVFVGGSVIPGLLIPTLVKKALLVMSIVPQVHMLIMLRAAVAAQDKKKKSKNPHEKTANEIFTKGVLIFTGFAILSIGVTIYSIFSD